MTATTPLEHADALTPEELDERALYRRAVEAAIWGMPIASVDAMRRAFFRDGGARYGDFVYLSHAADWRFQTPTPNASTLYLYSNFNTRSGPLVLEVPEADGAGLFGSLLDAWQVPIADVGPEGEDRGAGGRYLVLPPAWPKPVPSGFIPVRSETYNGYLLLRAVPASGSEVDRRRAEKLLLELRWCALVQVDHPPEPRHVDVSGTLYDGLVHFDDTFFECLARILGEEPVAPRDRMAMAHLRSLGIQRGRAFEPDDATREILRAAAEEAHATFMRAVGVGRPVVPGSHWITHAPVAARTAFTFRDGDDYFVDERGAVYFLGYAPPKRLGKASVYFTAVEDDEGAPLRGERSYRLRVPADAPVRQYWSACVYDRATAAFIRDAEHVSVDSFGDAARNADGSTDVYFGPTPPPGREANWIATTPGRAWFTMFRIYGPQPALFAGRWRLPDIEAL